MIPDSNSHFDIEEFKKKITPHDHDKVIFFTAVREPFGWLGNMSPYPLTYKGLDFRTSEHLFQWLRFDEYPHVQELIRNEKAPMGSKMRARVNRDLLQHGEHWDEHFKDFDRMRLCLQLKVEHHPNLLEMLRDTGDMILIENCSNKDRESARFWGAVYNEETNAWEGANVLGELWMELRASVAA